MRDNIRVKHLRGSTTENDNYRGPDGELTIDSDLNRLRIHDGVTRGGIAVLINTADLYTKSDKDHTHSTEDIVSGILDIDRLPKANLTTPGISTLYDNLDSTSVAMGLTAKAGKLLQDTKVPKHNPNLTGTATAPTPSINTNSNQIATTEFVQGIKGGLVKGDVGLGQVDNTPDSAKTVARANRADKLSTGRTINLTGDVSGSTLFDGSANVSIAVTILNDSHNHSISTIDNLQTELDSKVDKVVGKQLSTEDYTPSEKYHLSSIEHGAQVNKVLTVAGREGNVVLTKGDVGLSYENNTPDVSKVVASANTLTTGRTINGVMFNGSQNIVIEDNTKIPTVQKGIAGGVATLDSNVKVPLSQLPDYTVLPGLNSAIESKVDKVTGKGLSTNDYTSLEKIKLSKITVDSIGSINLTDRELFWSENTDGAAIGFENTGDHEESYLYFQTSDNSEEYFKWQHKSTGSNPIVEWMALKDGVLTVKGNTVYHSGNIGDVITANATGAQKLTTPRLIGLGGDATGSVSFDGSADVTIPVVIADNSHKHIIANIDNLQPSLDSKLTVDSQGDVYVPGSVNGKDIIVDNKVKLSYNATTDSLDFSFI